MWYPFIAYIRFLWRSTNKHGVHSPFVYNLAVHCLNAQTSPEITKKLKAYNKGLRSDARVLSVTDLGAGSKIFKSDVRKIADIARYAGTPLFKQQFLNRLVNYLKGKNVLELGTSLGMGSFALAWKNNARVVTIEGCPETACFAQEYLKVHHCSSVEVITGEFEMVIPKLHPIWDIVFIDGSHNYEKTLLLFEMLLPTLHNDSLIILDDIYLNKEMTHAWKTLCKHSKTTACIDLYHFGLLFFRKEQQPEIFTIRM